MTKVKRITEVILRITQTDESESGHPGEWDWASICDVDGETENVELMKWRHIEGEGKTMRFLVGVREVHISTMEIEAESAEQALQKIRDGEGREVKTEYSHTIDPDGGGAADNAWTVEKDD